MLYEVITHAVDPQQRAAAVGFVVALGLEGAEGPLGLPVDPRESARQEPVVAVARRIGKKEVLGSYNFV